MHMETNSLIAVMSEDNPENSPEDSLGTSDLDWAASNTSSGKQRPKQSQRCCGNNPR